MQHLISEDPRKDMKGLKNMSIFVLDLKHWSSMMVKIDNRWRSSFDFALDIVNWRYPQEEVEPLVQSLPSGHFQTGLVNHWVQIVFINHLSEVDGGEFFYNGLNPGEDGVFVFVESEYERYPAVFILVEDPFGDLQSLQVVRHEHEGKTEEYKPEFEFQVFFDLVEVQIVNLHTLVLPEQLNCLFCIFGMQIDTHHLALLLLYPLHNRLEGRTGPAPHIQEVPPRQVHVIDEWQVGCNGEESADEQVVDVGRKTFDQFQHLALN